jgi:hypothetical protein
MAFKDPDERRRIAALEEKVNQHDSVIAVWQNKVAQRSTGSPFF